MPASAGAPTRRCSSKQAPARGRSQEKQVPKKKKDGSRKRKSPPTEKKSRPDKQSEEKKPKRALEEGKHKGSTSKVGKGQSSRESAASTSSSKTKPSEDKVRKAALKKASNEAALRQIKKSSKQKDKKTSQKNQEEEDEGSLLPADAFDSAALVEAQKAAKELAEEPDLDLSLQSSEDEGSEEGSQASEGEGDDDMSDEELPASQDAKIDDSELQSESAESEAEEDDEEVAAEDQEPPALQHAVKEPDQKGNVRNSTTHKKQWDKFTREIQNRNKFPVALSSYVAKSKTDVFGAWLDAGGCWDETQMIMERMHEKKNLVRRQTEAIQGKELRKQYSTEEKYEQVIKTRKAEGRRKLGTTCRAQQTEEQKAEEMAPKTLKQQVDDKLPDILKDSTKSREISISLTNLNYGGQLAEQLLAFSKQMELCYKRLSELQKGKPADKDLRKYLNYVDSKKNWFKQAQAAAVGLQSGLKAKKSKAKAKAQAGQAGTPNKKNRKDKTGQ